jgi:NAD(P)-dependent dehydrogenase (short-subunit alcohol dehydrogenase family)
MANGQRWTESDVPSQAGRTFLVTGANSGLGFETSRVLAARGARVVMACRNPEKAKGALETIRREIPGADAVTMSLDLASLGSIRDFSEAFLAEHPALDVLIDNAGVMAIPQRRTADGFEMQIGTNHLGHFALTGLLIGRLLATAGSRVVVMTSLAHRLGRIDFDDLQSERSYGAWRAYGQSKLANLLFAFELQRRLARCGSSTIAVACHPGYAATQLQFAGPILAQSSFRKKIMTFGNRLFAQSAAMGALPSLYAATAPDVRGGEYFGPDGLFEMGGHPRRVRAIARAHDEALAQRLWQVSEELTGVRYDALA